MNKESIEIILKGNTNPNILTDKEKEAAQEVPVQEQSKKFNNFTIIKGKLFLDQVELKGVTSYEIKGAGKGFTELNLKMFIDKSNMLID